MLAGTVHPVAVWVGPWGARSTSGGLDGTKGTARCDSPGGRVVVVACDYIHPALPAPDRAQVEAGARGVCPGRVSFWIEDDANPGVVRDLDAGHPQDAAVVVAVDHDRLTFAIEAADMALLQKPAKVDRASRAEWEESVAGASCADPQRHADAGCVEDGAVALNGRVERDLAVDTDLEPPPGIPEVEGLVVDGEVDRFIRGARGVARGPRP